MNGLAGRHRDVEGHDQDQAVEAVGVAELGVLNAEAARFEVREHRLDAPATSILKGSQVAGFSGAFRQREAVHGDDPRLGVARILDDADVGARPPVGEFDVFQIVDPVLGALSSRRPGVAVD